MQSLRKTLTKFQKNQKKQNLEENVSLRITLGEILRVRFGFFGIPCILLFFAQNIWFR